MPKHWILTHFDDAKYDVEAAQRLIYIRISSVILDAIPTLTTFVNAGYLLRMIRCGEKD